MIFFMLRFFEYVSKDQEGIPMTTFQFCNFLPHMKFIKQPYYIQFLVVIGQDYSFPFYLMQSNDASFHQASNFRGRQLQLPMRYNATFTTANRSDLPNIHLIVASGSNTQQAKNSQTIRKQYYTYLRLSFIKFFVILSMNSEGFTKVGFKRHENDHVLKQNGNCEVAPCKQY